MRREKAESEKLKSETVFGDEDVPMRCVLSRMHETILIADLYTDGRRGAVESLAVTPGREGEALKGLATLDGCLAAILEAEFKVRRGVE